MSTTAKHEPGPGRLLYLVTEDWYFLSHRVPVARAAQATGFEVIVACRDTGAVRKIEDLGFRFAPIRLAREGRGPISEIAAVRDLVRLYRLVRPVIVHHVALKPVLYGSLAAEIAGVPHTVNALTGLGYVFTSESIGARLLGLFIRPLLRLVLKRKKSRVILQNRDDLEWLTALGLVDPARTKLIRGSGVDTKKFKPRTAPRPPGPLVAMMAARALVDKGIREFVDAGRILAERGADVRLVFVGAPDPANPGSVSEERLRRWQQQGWIEWWGFQEDMAEVWAEADIAVLPSYREGLPKTLLEAAAAGLPLVATDVPGCREIVREGETGLLVPVGDSRALADAIARLARDELFRHRLAHNVRYTAEREFSEEIVAQETLRLYKDLIGKR